MKKENRKKMEMRNLIIYLINVFNKRNEVIKSRTLKKKKKRKDEKEIDF